MKRSKDLNVNSNKDKIFNYKSKIVSDRLKKVHNMKSNDKYHIVRPLPALQAKILMFANHPHKIKMFLHHILTSAGEAKNTKFLLL